MSERLTTEQWAAIESLAKALERAISALDAARPIHLPTIEKAIEAVKALRPRAIDRRYISPLHAIDDVLEALDALRPTLEERT